MFFCNLPESKLYKIIIDYFYKANIMHFLGGKYLIFSESMGWKKTASIIIFLSNFFNLRFQIFILTIGARSEFSIKADVKILDSNIVKL